jgi:hypothetical protein
MICFCSSLTFNSQSSPPHPSDSGQDNDIVKCYCGLEAESGSDIVFVECEKCRTWQHCACVSWNPQLNKGTDFSLSLSFLTRIFNAQLL